MRWFRRNRRHRPIHIEITSVEEFAILCELIHGSELPHGRVHNIIDKLGKATANLRAAAKRQQAEEE